jgi:hypothetical protein
VEAARSGPYAVGMEKWISERGYMLSGGLVAAIVVVAILVLAK